MSDERTLAAGDFSSWLVEMRSALRGERGADVPCGGCTACCTSSQFIHIEPDETDTLAHIPPELLFPVPGLPKGHVLLGYDERGHCPMLVENRCSIYEHRPRTCRTYDCRIFTAAGLDLDDDPAKALIGQQVERWRFSDEHGAVRAAAAFLRANRARLPAGSVPANTTRLAVLAVEIADLFYSEDEDTGRVIVVEPDLDAVGERLAAVSDRRASG